MPLGVERDGGHERHLVLGAAPGLATSALAREVGVIQLHRAAQAMGAVLLAHGAVDSLMQQPRGGVAHPQLPFERKRRQPGLGLTDEVDRQEPGRQRQFGLLHQAAGRQRGLVPAPVALEQFARPVTDDIVLTDRAPRATEAIRPARLLDRLGTLRFSAEPAKEFRDGHAGLELDVLVGHGAC
jgi:hypothetical protein